MKNEKIVYEGKTHWVVFVLPIAFGVGWLFTLSMNSEHERFIYGKLSEIFGFIFLIKSLIAYFLAKYILTGGHVILKSGLLRRRTNEIRLEKMEGMKIEQSILGRLLNYGSIIVGGTGGTKDVHKYVANPMEFKRKINENSRPF